MKWTYNKNQLIPENCLIHFITSIFQLLDDLFPLLLAVVITGASVFFPQIFILQEHFLE